MSNRCECCEDGKIWETDWTGAEHERLCSECGGEGKIMTPEQQQIVAELREKWEASTTGEWEWWDNRGKPFWTLEEWNDGKNPPSGTIEGDGNQGVLIPFGGSKHNVTSGIKPEDAQFIAAAHNHLPKLLDALEKQEASILAHHQDCRFRQIADEQAAEIEKLRNAIRNQRGDDLCWIQNPENAEIAKVLPEGEFLESCRRYHAQLASERGVFSRGMTIAQLEAEIERLTSLFSLTKHPVTVCEECGGTRIPKPPKQPWCCSIGHARECQCLLCIWRRSGYEKDAKIKRLTAALESRETAIEQCARHIAELQFNLDGSQTALVEAENRAQLAETYIRSDDMKDSVELIDAREQIATLTQEREKAAAIISQIMTMHWDMAACRCWVCEAGRQIGCGASDQYLRWRDKMEYVSVAEPSAAIRAAREGK